MPKALMIGDLAAATGTKVNTIRFYEDIGLMPRAVRTASGRRTYADADLRRLRFIRHARGLGFNTEEIRSLLTLSDRSDGECDEVNRITKRHLKDVDAKIARLVVLRDELARIAEICAGGRVTDCRVLELLGGPA